MKKVRLDLDSLDVISFTTISEQETPRGTVEGRESYTFGGYYSCQGLCETREYETCREAGPSVGPSCDWDCGAPSVGCYPFTEAPDCA